MTQPTASSNQFKMIISYKNESFFRVLKVLILILFCQCSLYGQKNLWALNNCFELLDYYRDSLESTRPDEKGRYLYAYTEADSLITVGKDCGICFTFDYYLHYLKHFNKFKRAECIRLMGYNGGKGIPLSNHVKHLTVSFPCHVPTKFNDKLVEDNQLESCLLRGISTFPKFLERQTNLKALALRVSRNVKEIKTQSKLQEFEISKDFCYENWGDKHFLNLNFDMSELKTLGIDVFHLNKNNYLFNMKKLEDLHLVTFVLKENTDIFNAQNTPNLKFLSLNTFDDSDIELVTKERFPNLKILNISDCYSNKSKLDSIFSWVDSVKIEIRIPSEIDFREKKMYKSDKKLLAELPNKNSNFTPDKLKIFFDERDFDLKINMDPAQVYLNTGNYRNKKPIKIELGKTNRLYKKVIIKGKRKVDIDFNKYFENNPNGLLYIEYLDLYKEEIENFDGGWRGEIIFKHFRGSKNRLIKLMCDSSLKFSRESEIFKDK
jgi:hypothetical protein